MLRRFGSRVAGPSLRSRMEAAELGIVPTPPELDVENPTAGTVVPTSQVRPSVQDSGDYIVGLTDALAQAERERDAARAELAAAQQQLPEQTDCADDAESDSAAESPAQMIAQQILRIEELESQLRQVATERDEGRQNYELHLERCTRKRAATDGLDVVGSLQTGNQRLRAELRTATDRANRAETRIAGLELTVQTLAQAHTGQERPRVVVVDGAELVVPWGSRA